MIKLPRKFYECAGVCKKGITLEHVEAAEMNMWQTHGREMQRVAVVDEAILISSHEHKESSHD